jgi:hypothetical protein
VAKSRIAPGLLAALLAAAPAGAQQSADQAIAAQRSGLRQALRLDCPRGEDDEILVCGSREEERRQRLPPIEPAPSAADRAGGEQRAALATDTSRCTAVGRDQSCTRGLDMVGIGFAIARAVVQAIANRD